MAFVFDINDLDLGELKDFAEATGIDPMQLQDGWQPTLKAVRVFVWLIKRREDPTLTLEDARRVKVSELASLVPTAAGAGGGSAPSPSSATSSA
ncbi:MAG TPA: hypothetical protein PKA95_08295 [Thermomicrobiales bacterium]|nr:hypothetical protein [Thermomicrobiales bacterium]